VERVDISHKRNVILGYRVPERPKNVQINDKSTIALPETKHAIKENVLKPQNPSQHAHKSRP
jgi:hypothetical protein